MKAVDFGNAKEKFIHKGKRGRRSSGGGKPRQNTWDKDVVGSRCMNRHWEKKEKGRSPGLEERTIYFQRGTTRVREGEGA